MIRALSVVLALTLVAAGSAAAQTRSGESAAKSARATPAAAPSAARKPA